MEEYALTLHYIADLKTSWPLTSLVSIGSLIRTLGSRVDQNGFYLLCSDELLVALSHPNSQSIHIARQAGSKANMVEH